MIRGLYTVNRNMNVLQKRLENSSSNISNVKTPGYKFQDVVQSTQETHDMINYQGTDKINARSEVGPYIFGNQIDGVYRNFDHGSLMETRQVSDFALTGEGFFAIRLDSGQVAYTRNGNFKVSEDNRLVTMQGYSVLGRNDAGTVMDIMVNTNEFEVDNQGRVNGNLNLHVVDLANKDGLEIMGDTIFLSNQGGNIVENPGIKQGFLEMSNVPQVDEMVRLIEISREFESNQKVLHTIDETLGKAVNELGRV